MQKRRTRFEKRMPKGISDGERRTRQTWYSMWGGVAGGIRALNEGNPSKEIVARWRTIDNFIEDMGVKPPGRRLARLDKTLAYGPGNCEWLWPAEAIAIQNRRRRKLDHDLAVQIWVHLLLGHTHTETARTFSVPQHTVTNLVYRDVYPKAKAEAHQIAALAGG